MGDLDEVGVGGRDAKETMEESGGGFDAIPAGKYPAQIYSAEIKKTDKGDKMLKVRYDIVGPTFNGRVLFDNIMLTHSNEKTVSIGRGKLAALALACGFPKIPSDSQVLVGKIVELKVGQKLEEYQGNKEMRNVIRDWKPYSGEAVPKGMAKGGGATGATGPDDDEIPF